MVYMYIHVRKLDYIQENMIISRKTWFISMLISIVFQKPEMDMQAIYTHPSEESISMSEGKCIAMKEPFERRWVTIRELSCLTSSLNLSAWKFTRHLNFWYCLSMGTSSANWFDASIMRYIAPCSFIFSTATVWYQSRDTSLGGCNCKVLLNNKYMSKSPFWGHRIESTWKGLSGFLL